MITVQTTAGYVEGSLSNGVIFFRGVPYAAALTAESRWELPKPHEKWSGKRDCTQPGVASESTIEVEKARAWLKKSKKIMLDEFSPVKGETQGDDCLNASIYTLDADPEASMPVMVFIHGGGFRFGSAAHGAYDGTNLAKKEVVVVVLQYRLGLAGFAHFSNKNNDGFGADNRGFHDMVAGLEWVHNNIRKFGGNPDCVTLFGESAGATAVNVLSASPLCKGLIHRAIAMSPVDWVAPANEYHHYYSQLLKSFGITSNVRKALTDSTRAQRIKWAAGCRPVAKKDAQFMPNLAKNPLAHFGAASGTDLLPISTGSDITGITAQGIDLMIGTMRDDGHLASIFAPIPSAAASLYLMKMLSPSMPGGNSKRMLQGYKELLPEYSSHNVRNQLVTDTLYRSSIWRTAQVHASASAGRTWHYQINFESDVADMGATHSLDVFLTFDTVSYSKSLLIDSEKNNAMASRMSDTWVAFAKTGNPNNTSIPEWKSYGEASRYSMLFDIESKCVTDYDGNLRELWKSS